MTKWVRVRLANSLTFFIALPLGRLTNRRVRIGGKPAGGTMVPNHGLALRSRQPRQTGGVPVTFADAERWPSG